VARLRGSLTFRLETEYHERLTAAHKHLNALNADVDALTRQYDSFVRTRQAATHSYVGYDAQIERLRVRVGDALEGVNNLMARQGHMIETGHQSTRGPPGALGPNRPGSYAVADSYVGLRAHSLAPRTLMRRLASRMLLAPALLAGCAKRLETD
jgi:hypothetical protein